MSDDDQSRETPRPVETIPDLYFENPALVELVKALCELEKRVRVKKVKTPYPVSKTARTPPPGYRPISEFIEAHRGEKYILDCGHRWIVGHHWSNTAIFSGDRAVCHGCGY